MDCQMGGTGRRVVVSTRVTAEERAQLELVAQAQGKSVSDIVWERTVPWSREQILQRLLES